VTWILVDAGCFYFAHCVNVSLADDSCFCFDHCVNVSLVDVEVVVVRQVVLLVEVLVEVCQIWW
jgi:hypothetical protein